MTNARRAPAAPTGDPRTWDCSQLQDWFKTHKGGKWAQHASKFSALDGSDMTTLAKEDVLRRVPDNGDAIYCDWQTLHAAGT